MPRDEETIVSPGGVKPADPLEGVFTKSHDKAKGKGKKEADPNSLWYIHGKAYDLTDFVNVHPGGWVWVRPCVCVCGCARCALCLPPGTLDTHCTV